MIEVKNLSKTFGERKILNDITSSFEDGKTNLIIGASGSGKSTLARCIVGLVVPEEGEVLFDGRDFLKMDAREKKELRKEVGFLFQGSALFDNMTVAENIQFPLDILTNLSKAEKAERVDSVLERVELSHAKKLVPAELSGGMKKRVGIARSIAPRPKYLFCDEPNSGLDPQTSIVIDNLIQEITYEYNITTLVITHDMNSVIEIGDHVLFIHKGNNAWEGDKHTILSTEQTDLVDFVYASQFMKNLRNK